MPVDLDRILTLFEEINTIPRCSGNEAGVRRWLRTWALDRNLASREDAAGNLVVQLPATGGANKGLPVVIQGHMDMVCEKRPDVQHDFTRDPIRCLRQDEWLTADGTSLGADNGIAIAYAMALAEDETLQRPPLELLFTVDEETGLNGVKNLTSDMIRGRILINLDSEDEGIFTVGCAGGEDTRITLPLQTAALPDRWPVQRIILGGLKGGHSGVDIHKHRANANKLMARVLTALHQHAECRLIDMQGGTRHNAIPRDAEALVAWQPPEPHNLQQVIDQMAAVFRQEYAAVEPSLSVTTAAAPAGTVSTGLDLDSTERAIWLLLALPHGVAGMSSELDGLVETSNNLAKVQLRKDQLCIHTSQRSARTSRLAEMTASIHAVADLAGASVNDENAYPPWPPDMRAPLLEKSKQVYHRMFGTAPVVQVIHAGLECAIIGDRFPGMQMISFGPTIENPHSPSERLNIASVARVWRFLTKLLAELK